MTSANKKIQLRKTTESDLETLFEFQLDEEGIYLAAFTSKDPTDKDFYMERQKRFLKDKTINAQTILYGDEIAGSIAKFEIDGVPEITYWIGRNFWNQGIATNALKEFLKTEEARPIRGRTAFDNIGSQKVLEKSGFKITGTDKGFANARGKETEEFIYILT
ncbi:MAG TPA: GNAT family N-acetyltransferase [Ignavibacteria bacterium]|nr:GNAT family N-acetyltransferase [Ignavibacteria bacterium]HMR41426.1 GNAT family N-acetyltransferase [Ignavibacteria bacterium]